ncbi:hypothetical protein OIU84_002775 [Salix udensis]|uniref:Uncharacterized protein n=1 Tax=Salix udensis TaxID=889485 RepID=A0AAD6K5F1_9ROSI|nr:hypothetical protein OIU84_002775 [Salix udensis]
MDNRCSVNSSEGAGLMQTFVAVVSSKVDAGLQDPMLSEAVAAVNEWEPVPKKHLSNRQPRMKNFVLGGFTTGSVLGMDCATAKGKSVEAVLIGSAETDLVASGSKAAGSTLGMDNE